jgi:hypothetical protein
LITSKLKHISEIIDDNYTNLAGLSRKAGKQSSLSKYLRENLQSYGDCITSAHINDSNVLIIGATSPELANRLRYEEAEIKALCGTIGQYPKKIKISAR